MKIKNLVAYAMLALGAVAAPFAGRAEVTGGDIYSVDLSTKFGGVIPAEGTTLTIGESVTVRVRLVNKTNSEGVPLDWYFFENATMPSGTDPTTSYFAPQLGLMLGGQQVFADYLGSEQTAVSGKNAFTDLYFHYTVKSGDLALPARFMTIEGKAVSDEDDATDYAIHFCNYLGAYWRLTNAAGAACVFHFCSDPLIPNPDPTWTAGEPHRYITGTGLGINVKTVDFDATYFKDPSMPGVDDGIWRQLYVGLSTALPSLPTVKVDGFADVAATMYVWVENEDNDDPVAQVLASDNPEKIDDRWVIKVPIAKGAQSATFRLQGVRVGTVKVRMSASRELSYTKGGDVIEDWVERNVSVVPAPNPYVMVETLNMAGDAQTIFTCSPDYQTPVGMFRITFSQPPTDKLRVSLVPDDPAITNEHLIAVSKSGTPDDMPWEDLTMSLDLEAGEMPPPLYIYALGSTSRKYTFTPVLSGPGAAMYTGESRSSSLYLEGIEPVITSPAEDDVLSAATLGVDYKLNISVSDTFRMLNEENGWTVSLCCSAFGDEDWHDFTELTVNTKVKNRITVTIPKDGSDSFIHAEEDMPIEIMVANKNEIWSEEVVAYISVREGKVASATVEGGEKEFAEGAGRTAKVYFSLSQSDNKNLYAFIEPINSDASNKVTSAQLAKAGNYGVLISRGKTDSGSNSATVSLQDGDASALFQVVLCSSQIYSEGSKVTTYTPGQCTINITNVVPQVTAASMGGQAIKVNGGVTKAVAQNVEKKFTVAVSEPSLYDLDATGDDAFLTQWKFGTSDWEDMKGNPNTTNITHTFYSPGDQEVTVRCQDKDMRALGQWSEEFTFTVPVLDQPKVIITPASESNQYYEDATSANTIFNVSLTAAPDIADSTARLTVKLTVKNNTTGAEEPSTSALIVLSRYEVTFSSGVLSGPTFSLSSLDGTAASAAKGYTIKAEVTNAEIDVEGKTWDAGETEVYIINRAPEILNPSEKLDKDGNPIASTTTIGTENTLAWSLRDVDADKTGMSVTWETSEGQRKTYKQGDPGWADVMSGTHTFKFESAGEKSITLTALDKDGESVSRTFYYTISPSKNLKLIPHGPTAGKGTALSKRYRAAAGIGEGRVWAKNASTVEGFEALYNCGLSKSWTIYAYGYKVGETSGAVTRYASRETPLDAEGNANPAGGYAYADSEKDSFLYTWIQLVRGESGGFSDSYLNGATAPEYPEIVDVGAEIALPAESGQDGNYDDTILEAVFSKEFLPTDNMGDINQDGIPDAYVDKYGLGVVDESGKITGNDLEPADGWNEDEDFLPTMEVSAFGNLIPGLKGTWVEFGMPFDARTEVRGYHDGLNDAPAIAGLTGVKPHRIYEVTNELGQATYDPAVCTISRLEYLAWKDSGLPADKWSPERPTDPSKPDTDKDGFTDGYEYFFWYRAHVGYLDTDGSHKYLTGERYDPANPGVGIPITSKEIEELFDPLTKYGDASAAEIRDTDNDGLPDLLEFEIGTNPLHWDTDGDGLPDGYEVMFRDGTLGSGDAVPLDPLLASTVVGLPDTVRNYDGDYMAFYTNLPYAVFALQGEGGAAAFYAGEAKQLVPQQFAALTNGEGAVDFKDGWVITAADGGKYMTTKEISEADYYEFEGAYYLRTDLGRDVCWTYAETKFSDGGAEKTAAYRSLPAELPRGTRLGTAVEDGVTNVLVSATNYVTMVTEFGKIEVIVNEMDGTATTNKTLAAWDQTQRPPQRAYHVWQYGRKGILSVNDLLYGGWALSGEAFLKNGAVVLRMPASETVFAYHNLAYSKGGFDPRTGWSGDNDFGISWAIDDAALTGGATNHLGAVNTRAYNDYDEFLVMAYFINNSIAGLAVADAIPDVKADYATCLLPADYTPTRFLTLQTIWGRFCTNAYDPDSDMDGVPDGWELYIMGGPDKDDDKHPVLMALPGPISPWSPRFNLADVVNKDSDGDGLDERAEFSGVNSVKAYESVSSTITLVDEFWTNKAMPTDPWNADTDDDGIPDGAEGAAFKYGEAENPGAGGGLNPLSWDTDGDGLPDPWELQYAGTYTAGEKSESTTTSIGTDGSSNTTVTVTREKGTWSGGMDGTVSDAMEDYDADGLLNWQEYMVNCMRHFRYDDTTSRWNNDSCTEMDIDAALSFASEGDMESWGQWWGSRLVDEQNYDRGYNPHLFDGAFDNGSSWFSLCTNEWDTAHGRWYMFYDGVYHDLSRPPARYKFGTGDMAVQYNRFSWKFAENGPPNFDMGPIKWGLNVKQMYVPPKEYPGTDPTKPDTDNDGMDDYYELFHGLNPLLGEAGNYDNGHRPPVDRVFEAYGGGTITKTGNTSGLTPFVSAKNNYWLNAMTPHATVKKDGPRTKYGNDMDFEQYPWLAGTSEADPDGDNIRNYQEAIMANMQAASTYLHTDPTPLWMTDASYSMSFVHRYYSPLAAAGWIILSVPGYFDYDSDGDGVPEHYEFKDFPGFKYDESKMILTTPGYDANPWHAANSVASFEQNEGYDSDHDFLGDFEEAQGRTKQASDPQDSDDPRRRQAMWFNGTDAFLQTPLAKNETSPIDGIGIQPEQPFLYFTVECWAKPANPGKKGLQTLVERAIWTDPAHAADEKYLRKNFLLGIRDGHWYAKYDSTGTDALKAEEIADGPAATTNWTHLAMSYGEVPGIGLALRLYVNGDCVKTKATEVQPEHGTKAATINETGELRDGKLSYSEISILAGASAATELGIIFDSLYRGLSLFGTTLADYTAFYEGYIDEIRIWDGARSEKQIGDDHMKRYTAEDAIANRLEFFNGWSEYGTRAPSTSAELIPELRYHFTFDHLPGAPDVADVIAVPAGFSTDAAMTDAAAIWMRPQGWVCPHWNSVAVRSTVYSDPAWVPWINNTITHLPRFDQTTQDSFYWSENYAGADAAMDLGFKNFLFPRTHETPSVWTPMTYTREAAWDSTPTRYNIIKDTPLYRSWCFTIRHSLVEGGDFLPMGGAFPKRISAAEGGMWDGQGAADAWAQTGVDSNGDGLPDWWEAYARANYAEDLDPSEPLTWNTLVVRDGVPMTAMQAYLRDLAEGLLSDGDYHAEYRDTVDSDGDGLPDWWESYWALKNTNGFGDPDHDGLSNFQEWKVSEDKANGFGTENGYPLVNPTLMRSHDGQDFPDYFLRMDDGDTAGRFEGMYLGEIVADHDFMEDDLEGDLGTDRTLYDAWSDYDEDGWSAWAELRYSTFKMTRAARFVSHIVGDEEVKDFPIPVIHATLRYNGAKTLAGSNATITVEAYSGNNVQKSPNAYYFIRPGSREQRQLYLGAYEDRVIHGTLTPGRFTQADLNSISLQGAFVQPNDLFSWIIASTNGTGEAYTGTYEEMRAAYLQYGTNMTVAAEAFGWFDIVEGNDPSRNWLQVTQDEKTQTGFILADYEKVGEIDLATGDFTFDLGKLKGKQMVSGISFEQMFYRLQYTVAVPALQTKALTLSLANPDIGSLTEGTTAFVAYMDIDGDGYTPGTDPIGFVRDVAIGWDQVPELTIEMTDGSQACGAAFAYDDDVDMLRVVRTSINGSGAGVKHRIVYSRNHELATTTSRRNVYDGDYLTTGAFGLDWANLATDLALMDGISESDVTQVGYTVIRGKGSIINIPEDTVVTTFTVPYSAARTAPVPYSPSVSAMPIVETQRPTFRWSVPEGYTAFRLQISDAGGKQVYVSDLQKMPPRDASSRYFWTPPVYIGTVVSTNDSWQIANNSNYTWRVAVYNPKFRTTEWSDPAAFQTRLAEKNDFTTKYGSADVRVRYFGPATNELKDVIVQLYRNADFTGAPAARTRLFDVTGELISLTNGQTVSFHGLESGDYYACVFIDRNGDSTRQRYETWGYSANVGRGTSDIWTPVAVTVDAENAKIGSVTVYLEDTDINQNDVPDCLDDEAILKSADSEIETTTATDTDGDGMPDKWEEENGLNPYDPSDAENAIDGDVMAYLDLGVCLVHVGKPDGSESAWYALPDYETEPARLADGLFQPLLPAEKLHLAVTTWKNGNYYGLGTNVTFKAADGLVVLDSKLGTLRLVHAQVYANKGFNPKTAVPLEDAVDTKPFTALDKYLVGAYFDAIGVHAFKDRHLDPNDMDADGDGIPDGWELYVMYGKTWGEFIRGVTEADSKSITPFDRADAMKTAPATGSQLLLCEEYDAGFLPTDPWHLDTDKDGVIDFYAYQYHLKGEEAGKDFDGDGLSNYAEYLISEVFKAAKLDPENPKTDGACVDYFRKMGDLYFGEIFTDHDQVNDLWESASPDAANRYAYDPSRDDDKDGWSNWAEAKAGTDPETEADVGIDGYVLAAYPVPCIETLLTCSSTVDAAAPVVIRAWSQKTDPTMARAADAVWHLGDAANGEDEGGKTTAGGKDSAVENTSQKYIGLKPNGVRTFNLGPGAIQHGSVRICYKDLSYCKVKLDQYHEVVDSKIGDPDSAQWYFMAQDREGVIYTVGGIFADEQAVGTVDYETGRITVDFNGEYMTGPQLGDPDWAVDTEGGSSKQGTTGGDSMYDLLNLDQSYVLVTWSSCTTLGSLNRKLYLSDADNSASGLGRGHVREGLNTFMAFVDSDGDGEYTPGEPFGVARDVDVGWDGAKLEIGLTLTSAITPRITFGGGSESAGGEKTSGTGEDDPFSDRLGTSVAWILQDAIAHNTEDRVRLQNNRIETVSLLPDSVKEQRIRVVRWLINDVPIRAAGVAPSAILDKTVRTSEKTSFTEADILADGTSLDTDWERLYTEIINDDGVWRAIGGEVTRMCYLVVVGDGDIGWDNAESTNVVKALSTAIVRYFGESRVTPVAVAPNDGYVFSARPTFQWTMNCPADEGYTAFKLQILKEDGKTVVYDSGVRRTPPQATDGSFEWTADAFAGDVLATGNYKWRVAMYNAKFRSDVWSNTGTFSIATGTQQETDDHNYSSVDVSVKYTGPALVLSAAGKVRVQAFETADFSGTPAAQISITDINSVKDATDIRKNGTLIGLKSGTYYVRAYIDSNGNGVKDGWESWGAAKDAVIVKSNQLAPIVGLYIEDADTDQDWLPDAWEYAKYGNLETKGADIDPQGRIVLKTEIYENLTNGTANISRFLSGASLTFFQNLGNVSLALGLGDVTEKSIAEIRAAVEKNIDPTSVKITSLTVDATNGKVYLTVAAKATDSIAGYLIEPLYELPKSTDITINIYRKDNLATDKWTFVKAVPKTITTTLETRVEVPIEGIDFNSGFYKVEIVQ